MSIFLILAWLAAIVVIVLTALVALSAYRDRTHVAALRWTCLLDGLLLVAFLLGLNVGRGA